MVRAIVQFVADFGLSEDKKSHDAAKSMSIAIAIIVQSYLAVGGNPTNGEGLGEMVKQGMIAMMDVYADMGRINVNPGRGRIN